MIYEEAMPGSRNDRRTVVICDEPRCQTSYYVPNMTVAAASARMQRMGWEVTIAPPFIVNGLYGRAFPAHSRCPDHVQGE